MLEASVALPEPCIPVEPEQTGRTSTRKVSYMTPPPRRPPSHLFPLIQLSTARPSECSQSTPFDRELISGNRLSNATPRTLLLGAEIVSLKTPARKLIVSCTIQCGATIRQEKPSWPVNVRFDDLHNVPAVFRLRDRCTYVILTTACYVSVQVPGTLAHHMAILRLAATNVGGWRFIRRAEDTC